MMGWIPLSSEPESMNLTVTNTARIYKKWTTILISYWAGNPKQQAQVHTSQE